MAKFLVRSYSPDDPGYREVDSPTGLLPRLSPGDPAVFGSGEGAFAPWAITPSRKVIYARYGEHRSAPNVGGVSPVSAAL